MPRGADTMHPTTVELLLAYRDPVAAAELPPAAWSRILGAARRGRCAGHLRTRLVMAEVLPSLPPEVRGQFQSIDVLVRERRHLVRWELGELAQVFRNSGLQVVALKGAAYELQGRALAAGRMVGDIDLMVSAAQLAHAEAILKTQGWRAGTIDAYDEQYYRRWAHEIPPLRHPSRELEVDLHHALTPAMTGRGIDTARVMSGAVSCRGFLVLDPLDQIIHCAVHTFKDSDLAMRLREVMDFDLLVREHLDGVDERGRAEFSAALLDRADALGAGDAVRWAAHYAARWLDTPIVPSSPGDGVDAVKARRLARAWCVPAWRCWWMDALVPSAMLPGELQEPGPVARLSQTVLLARYHLKRMPLVRLVPHLARKAWQRVLQRSRQQA